MNMKNNAAVILFAAIVVLVSACGKRGYLDYPEQFAPVSVTNLRATRDGGNAVLVWKSPRATASGKKLKDLREFVIRRAKFSRIPRDYDFYDIATIQANTSKEEKEGPLAYKYTDSVPQDEDYLYRVIPVNMSGTEGDAAMVTLQNLPALQPKQPEDNTTTKKFTGNEVDGSVYLPPTVGNSVPRHND